MNSTADKRLFSLLVNDDFINYVLNPNLILKELWEDYLSTHPEDIPILNEARQILLGEKGINILAKEDSYDLECSIFERCGLVMY